MLLCTLNDKGMVSTLHTLGISTTLAHNTSTPGQHVSIKGHRSLGRRTIKQRQQHHTRGASRSLNSDIVATIHQRPRGPELAQRRGEAALGKSKVAKLRHERPGGSSNARDLEADDKVGQGRRGPRAPAVGVARVRRVDVAAVVAVGERPVGQVALDDGRLRPVLVVQVPAPAPADEVERAVGLAGEEVRLNLKGGDEGRYGVGKLWRDGANVVPVVCQLRGNVLVLCCRGYVE